MRKKNAALLLKSLLIIFVLVIALYFQKNIVPQKTYSYEAESAIDYSHGGSQAQNEINPSYPFFSSRNSSSNSEYNSTQEISLPETSNPSGNSGQLSLSTYDNNYSTGTVRATDYNDDGSQITPNTYSNAASSIALSSNAIPILQNTPTSKNKNSESHPFGTTIASREGGIGSNPIGPTPDLPMAPPAPSPLDGGMVALLILCASLAVFKLWPSKAYFSKA